MSFILYPFIKITDLLFTYILQTDDIKILQKHNFKKLEEEETEIEKNNPEYFTHSDNDIKIPESPRNKKIHKNPTNIFTKISEEKVEKKTQKNSIENVFDYNKEKEQKSLIKEYSQSKSIDESRVSKEKEKEKSEENLTNNIFEKINKKNPRYLSNYFGTNDNEFVPENEENSTKKFDLKSQRSGKQFVRSNSSKRSKLRDSLSKMNAYSNSNNYNSRQVNENELYSMKHDSNSNYNIVNDLEGFELNKDKDNKSNSIASGNNKKKKSPNFKKMNSLRK